MFISPTNGGFKEPPEGDFRATQGHSSCNLRQALFSVLCLPLYKNVRRGKAIAIFYMPTICQALLSRFIFMISFLSPIRTLQSRVFFFPDKEIGEQTLNHSLKVSPVGPKIFSVHTTVLAAKVLPGLQMLVAKNSLLHGLPHDR